jgi:hypothetical protein
MAYNTPLAPMSSVPVIVDGYPVDAIASYVIKVITLTSIHHKIPTNQTDEYP